MVVFVGWLMIYFCATTQWDESPYRKINPQPKQSWFVHGQFSICFSALYQWRNDKLSRILENFMYQLFIILVISTASGIFYHHVLCLCHDDTHTHKHTHTHTNTYTHTHTQRDTHTHTHRSFCCCFPLLITIWNQQYGKVIYIVCWVPLTGEECSQNNLNSLRKNSFCGFKCKTFLSAFNWVCLQSKHNFESIGAGR
jgi:hypothetical protein